MAGILVKGLMLVMWNICIPVLLVKLLMTLSSYEYIYRHSCLIYAHEVIGICGIYIAFEGHISCWHIHGYSIVGFFKLSSG